MSQVFPLDFHACYHCSSEYEKYWSDDCRHGRHCTFVVLCVLHVQKKVNKKFNVHSKFLPKATALKILCVLYAYTACIVEIRSSSLDVKTSGNFNVKTVGWLILEVICVYYIIM